MDAQPIIDSKHPLPSAAEAPPGLSRWIAALRELGAATAGRAGVDFLRALARHLATALQVKWVLISEPVDPRLERARTVVFWDRAGFAPNFEYELAGTPSARVLDRHLCFYPHSVGERFPDDRRLAELRCASYAGAPLRSAEGELLGLIAVLHDQPLPEEIDLMAVFQLFAERAAAELERLRMRTALRATEVRFRSVIEGVSDLILVVGPDGHISYASPSSQRIGGYVPTELEGRSLLDFVHPDDRSAALEALEAAITSRGPGPTIQCRVRHQNGAWIHLEARGTAMLEDPFVRGIVVNARDTSERVLAEHRLAFQRNLLKQLTEASPDALLMVSADREILYINHRFAELWGIPAEALLRRDADAWAYARPQVEDAACLAEWMETVAVDPGRKLRAEVRLRDGRCLELLSTPVTSPADHGNGRLWSFRDVTERRDLDARLLHAQRIASIGTVASGIVHEFRNILMPIMTGLDIVALELPSDHPLQGPLGTMREAAARARDITKHLLTLGRSRPPVMEWVQPEAVFASGVRLLRASLPSSVVISLQCTPGLPPIAADEVQIHQAMLNLAINSWQAMAEEEGTIAIVVSPFTLAPGTAGPAPDMAPGTYVQVAFGDDGHGMEAPQLARLFEPFFTTKPAGQGTGLGLTTVRTIVLAHHGAIAVASKPAKGTEFRIYLPAVRSAPPAP